MSVSKAIYEYYQIMQKTVELGGFQVLAHLDFPKLFFDKWVIDDDVLDMILSIMIDKNILLEVNTSSLNDSCLLWDRISNCVHGPNLLLPTMCWL